MSDFASDFKKHMDRIKAENAEWAEGGQRIGAEGNGRAALPAPKPFTAESLQTMVFPPLRFILPGIIPEGAALLVSRPKLGKSWLVLDLAIAVATGRFTLGELKPLQGSVLYLALEDGKRRLQRRVKKLLGSFSGSWSEDLEFQTEWPRADQGGLEGIDLWFSHKKGRGRLAIIDTLAQFRKLSTGKAQIYAEDYAAISGLQKLATKHNAGIVIVHHDRKNDAGDVFDTVSGTLGLTAAADTILVMKRQAGAVTLHVQGRDIEDAEKALQFDKSSCKWIILGEAREIRRSNERARVLSALGESSEPMSPRDIMLQAQLANRNATDLLLYKMRRHGEIERVGRGMYTLPEKDGKDRRKDHQVVETSEENADLSNLSDLSGRVGEKDRDQEDHVPRSRKDNGGSK
jgi:hypothetical protein